MVDPFIRRAKLVRVVDGDTIDVDIDLGFTITSRQRLRLAGIDTPEMRGSEKIAGREAKEAVIDFLHGKEIVVETTKPGKYGRYLATVYANGINLNLFLLDEGYAKVYGSK